MKIKKLSWSEIENKKIGDTKIDPDAEVDYRNVNFSDPQNRFENPNPESKIFFEDFGERVYYAAGRKRYNLNRFTGTMIGNEKAIAWIPVIREAIEILFDVDLEMGFSYNEIRKNRYFLKYNVPIAFDQKKHHVFRQQYSIVVRLIKFLLQIRLRNNSNLPVEILLHDWFLACYEIQRKLFRQIKKAAELRYCSAPVKETTNKVSEYFFSMIGKEENYFDFGFSDLRDFHKKTAILRSRPKYNLKWKLRNEIDESRIQAGLPKIDWSEYDRRIAAGMSDFAGRSPKFSILED